MKLFWVGCFDLLIFFVTVPFLCVRYKNVKTMGISLRFCKQTVIWKLKKVQVVNMNIIKFCFLSNTKQHEDY